MKVAPTLLRALLATLLLHSGSAPANPIYKCTNSEGRVTYSAMPCYGEQWKRMGAREAPPAKRESANPPAQAASRPPPTKTVKAPTPQ